MQFFWVNQNQTYKQEIVGGFLWSPKRKGDGHRNPFYEFMRIVSPGDLIFSFEGTYIRAIGVARSNAYESPKPAEFGNAGPNWSAIGWRIDVKFFILDRQIRPVDFMDEIGPALPEIYSPLQISGRGNQGVYLTVVKPLLAEVLISLIGEEAQQVRQMVFRISKQDTDEFKVPTAVGLVEWEEHLIEVVNNDRTLQETERMSLVLARRGQGVFKQNVMTIESQCRVTGVDKIEHLRASHIKPWRDCASAAERLSAENGLLLTPSIDHLFDRGFISFENDGTLLVSPASDEISLQKMGIKTDEATLVGRFTDEQKRFLHYHREEIFLEAKINF